MQATGTFTLTGWEPVTYDDTEGAQLGRVAVEKRFDGDLAGTSTAELLTVLDGEGRPAAYIGVERVTGTLDGRSGTFVLHHTAPGPAGEPIVIRVVPGTGPLPPRGDRLDGRGGAARRRLDGLGHGVAGP